MQSFFGGYVLARVLTANVLSILENILLLHGYLTVRLEIEHVKLIASIVEETVALVTLAKLQEPF